MNVETLVQLPKPCTRKRRDKGKIARLREVEAQECARYRASKLPNKWRIVGRYGENEPEFVVLMGPSERACMFLLKELFAEKTLDELNEIESIWIERWQMATPWREAGWMPVEEVPLINYRLRAAAFRGNGVHPISVNPVKAKKSHRSIVKVIPNAILNDEQWNTVQSLFCEDYSGAKNRASLERRNQDSARKIIESILWVLSKQTVWAALPSHLNHPTHCRQRFKTWAESGAFELAWDEVFSKIEALKNVDWRKWLPAGPGRKPRESHQITKQPNSTT